MHKFIYYIMIAILAVMLTGCGATAKMISAKSQGERTDVFTEVTDGGARDHEYADLAVKASIKTHEAGYFSGESENSLHGKPGYPFVLNIDGQAVVWTVDGRQDVKPAYDEQGKTSRDPEAGTGIKYTLEKRVRLRPGAHKVYFALPEDDYIVAADITLRSGEEVVLEFKPLYWHKHQPTRIPTFFRGMREYEIWLNGVKIN